MKVIYKKSGFKSFEPVLKQAPETGAGYGGFDLLYALFIQIFCRVAVSSSYL